MFRLNWVKVIMTVAQRQHAILQCVFVRTSSIGEAIQRASKIVRREWRGSARYPYCASYSSPQADESSLEVCNAFGDRLDLDRFMWVVTPEERLPFESPDGIIFDGNDPKDYHDHLTNAFARSHHGKFEELICCLDRNCLQQLIGGIPDLLPDEPPQLLLELIPNNNQAPKSLQFLNDGLKSRFAAFEFLHRNSSAILSNGMVALKMNFPSANVLFRLSDHKLVRITSTDSRLLNIYCDFLRSLDIFPTRRLYRIDDRIGHLHYEPVGVTAFRDLHSTLSKAGFKALRSLST